MEELAEKSTKWSSWMEMKVGYLESRKKISKHINKKNKQENKDNYDVVDLEIAREIRRNMTRTLDDLEKKTMYEFNAFSLKDIRNSKLTKDELKVLKYRIEHHYTYEKISEILSKSQSSIFEIYKNAQKKIQKYVSLNNREKNTYRLSNQQKKVFTLIEQGKTNKQIAEALGISINTVKVQKNRIKKILRRVNKKPE